jgi:transglutaminase-like putative cysteine protease
MRLTIHHVTVYRYARPVLFQEHRLLLFPRGSHDVQMRSSRLTITPEPELSWSQDAVGNTVATATFAQFASTLSVRVEHEVEHTGEPWPIFRIASEAHAYPFSYAPDLRAELQPLLLGADDDRDDAALRWAEDLVTSRPIDTMTLLTRMNSAIGETSRYVSRVEQGTQTPAQTLALGSGSCRDYAALLIAGARHLGFAARAASGYAFDPDMPPEATGATHAWAEVYLPGGGWIAFDPTSGRTGSAGLVTAATGRSSERVLPVIGGYSGEATDFLSMDVSVSVTEG